MCVRIHTRTSLFYRFLVHSSCRSSKHQWRNPSLPQHNHSYTSSHAHTAVRYDSLGIVVGWDTEKRPHLFPPPHLLMRGRCWSCRHTGDIRRRLPTHGGAHPDGTGADCAGGEPWEAHQRCDRTPYMRAPLVGHGGAARQQHPRSPMSVSNATSAPFVPKYGLLGDACSTHYRSISSSHVGCSLSHSG